jgi:hypothetical protein
MSHYGAPWDETFTVPEGKRAVIRTVSFQGGNTAGALIQLDVHGVPSFIWTSPGTWAHQDFETRYVAYERETIRVLTQLHTCGYSVSGYLFADPVGRPDDADNEEFPSPGYKPAGA